MTYMPVDGKPDRLHVGARALNLDDWFEINEDYEDYVAYKLKLLSTKHDEVFVSLPLGDRGSREVLALMREHLPRVFPQRWPAGVTVDESRHPLEAASLLVQEDLALMTQVGVIGFFLLRVCAFQVAGMFATRLAKTYWASMLQCRTTRKKLVPLPKTFSTNSALSARFGG